MAKTKMIAGFLCYTQSAGDPPRYRVLDVGGRLEFEDSFLRPDERRKDIHALAKEGETQAIRALVKYGQSVDTPDENGDTPLTAVVKRGMGTTYARNAQKNPEEVVATLLELGANPLAPDHRDGLVPMRIAESSGCSMKIQESLAIAGGLPKEGTLGGYHPLEYAMRNLSPDAMEAGLRGTSDVEAADERGVTLLHKATAFSDRKLGILLAAGADPEARDENGRTPLHYAATGDREDICRTLLNAGADPTARDLAGRTPDESAFSEDLRETLRNARSVAEEAKVLSEVSLQAVPEAKESRARRL